MKLVASLLTTVGITGAVWGALHIQPAIADASTEQPIKEASTIEPSITKPVKIKPQITTNTQPIASQATQTTYLQGLRKTISLDHVPELWGTFYQNLETNAANNENVAKQQGQQQQVVVIYQDINSDFSEATVTIGFPTKLKKSNKNKSLIEVPSKTEGTLLLSKGEHTELELAQAWEGIAILKEVDMVIERHQLNQHGLPDSSELYVYYKNNQ